MIAYIKLSSIFLHNFAYGRDRGQGCIAKQVKILSVVCKSESVAFYATIAKMFQTQKNQRLCKVDLICIACCMTIG